jgi:hypothetical protein
MKADYGKWVSTKLILVPGALSLVFAALAILVPVLSVLAVLSFLCFLYFAYARFMFSPAGGNLQVRMQDLVLDRVAGWDGTGKALDVGCGNGPLAIQIAERDRQAKVVEIDDWGAEWEYSKEVCDRNATIERIADRVTFERASHSSFPRPSDCRSC